MLTYREYDYYVKGVKLHYYRTGGDKPPLMMIHGSADSGLCWYPVAEWLAQDFDVILPDAQGHGQSDRLTPEFSFRDLSEQAIALIEQLRLSRPVLMGHSMGADTIVDLEVQNPGLAAALILEDPIWQYQPVPGQETPRQLRQRAKMAQAVINFSRKSETELLEESRKANPGWSETDLRLWAESKKQFDTTLFSNAKYPRAGYIDFAARADSPTLLITSEWGVTTPTAAQKAVDLWQSASALTWVLIRNAGHNIRRDKLEEFKSTVEQFLEAGLTRVRSAPLNHR